MECSKCNVAVTGLFCASCGTRVTANGGAHAKARKCAQCEAPLSGRFCPACGHDNNDSNSRSSSPSTFKARSFGGGGPVSALQQSRTRSQTDGEVEAPSKRKWFVRYQSQSASEMQAPLTETVVRYHGQYQQSPNAPQSSEQSTYETPRERVLSEILNTEVDYCNDLNTICTIFVEPLRDGELLSRGEHLALFSNVQQLYEVNLKLLEQLKTRGGLERVGDIFLGMADYMKCYAFYCANQQMSFDTLDKLQRKKNKDLQSFLAYCKSRPECFGLDLGGFLVKPMQRICKYPLLLKELLRLTRPDAPGYANLQRALERMEATVLSVNERKRESEQTAVMIDVLQRIVCAPDCELLTPTRRFVSEGDLMVESIDGRKKKKLHYYLFNDALLLTKKKRGKFHLKAYLLFKVMLIRESPGNPKVFEVVHLIDKTVWILLFGSSAARDDFLAELSDLVANHLQELYDIQADVEQHMNNPNEYDYEEPVAAQPVHAEPVASKPSNGDLRTYGNVQAVPRGKSPVVSPRTDVRPSSPSPAAATASPVSPRKVTSPRPPAHPRMASNDASSNARGGVGVGVGVRGRGVARGGGGAVRGRRMTPPTPTRGRGASARKGSGRALPSPVPRKNSGSAATKPVVVNATTTAKSTATGAVTATPASTTATPSSAKSNAPSSARARLALRRVTQARFLADTIRKSKHAPAESAGDSKAADAFNAPKVLGDDDDMISFKSVFHDEHETYEIRREDVDFVELRKQIHERHKLQVPRQFLVLKHRGKRIMSQRDLLAALKTDTEMRLDVFQ